MRLISYIDLVNFHGQPQEKNKKYEGNIEEQAKIMHAKGKRREIVEVVRDPAEDVEMAEEDK